MSTHLSEFIVVGFGVMMVVIVLVVARMLRSDRPRSIPSMRTRVVAVTVLGGLVIGIIVVVLWIEAWPVTHEVTAQVQVQAPLAQICFGDRWVGSSRAELEVMGNTAPPGTVPYPSSPQRVQSLVGLEGKITSIEKMPAAAIPAVVDSKNYLVHVDHPNGKKDVFVVCFFDDHVSRTTYSVMIRSFDSVGALEDVTIRPAAFTTTPRFVSRIRRSRIRLNVEYRQVRKNRGDSSSSSWWTPESVREALESEDVIQEKVKR